MDKPNEPHYDVVWPRSRLAVDKQTPASRLDTLAGKRIGFLWDYLFRGEELFPAIADELRDRFADIEFVALKRSVTRTVAMKPKSSARYRKICASIESTR